MDATIRMERKGIKVMRILVTGASGFIGTHVVKELRKFGHEVNGVDLEDGNLVVEDTAAKLITKYQPEVVVHAAALVGRLFGEQNLYTTITSNALATAHVAVACANAHIRLVYTSTSEAYGDHGEQEIKEEVHGTLPYNMYGLSKRWGEEAARLYMPKDMLQILRLSMPYGPGLPAGQGRAALTTFIWNACHNKPLTVHKGGKRCWLYITDAVAAMRMIIESEQSGVYLVGRHDNETSMLRVAELACDIAKAKRDLIQLVDPPSDQIVVKRLRADKLVNMGWTPKVSLEEGISRTYEVVKTYDEYGRPPKKG